MNVDPLLSLCVDPSAQNAPTGEDERMWAVPINDGQLKIAVEWCGRNRLPLHTSSIAKSPSCQIDPIRTQD
jgi:hypothetical protein